MTTTDSDSCWVRQNFHVDCENAINKQINMELHASYVYLSMAYYFDRDDVALPGMHAFFKRSSADERGHAMLFLMYQNKRGGRVVLQDIKCPARHEWGSAEEAMNAALKLERDVNESLIGIHAIASARKDDNFCDFLETNFLQEQVDSIKEFADHVTNLRRVGDGVGTFVYDRALLEKETDGDEQEPKA